MQGVWFVQAERFHYLRNNLKSSAVAAMIATFSGKFIRVVNIVKYTSKNSGGAINPSPVQTVSQLHVGA